MEASFDFREFEGWNHLKVEIMQANAKADTLDSAELEFTNRRVVFRE